MLLLLLSPQWTTPATSISIKQSMPSKCSSAKQMKTDRCKPTEGLIREILLDPPPNTVIFVLRSVSPPVWFAPKQRSDSDSPLNCSCYRLKIIIRSKLWAPTIFILLPPPTHLISVAHPADPSTFLSWVPFLLELSSHRLQCFGAFHNHQTVVYFFCRYTISFITSLALSYLHGYLDGPSSQTVWTSAHTATWAI